MSKKPFPKISQKKIVITGGAGFIGSHLAEILVDDNSVTIFDNFRRNALQYTSLQSHRNINLVRGDVLNIRQLQKVLVGNDIVIHAAAVAGVSSYYSNPLVTLEIDALGGYNVLKIASESSLKQVIIFSSSEVYGTHGGPISETTPTCQGPTTDSRWSYAVGKLTSDHFAFAFAKMTKLNITIIRPFNIFGPGQVGEGAIQQFVPQALNNQPLIVRGNGKQVRAWCYIKDFVRGVMHILGNKKAYNQIFNIGNPDNTITITDLAANIIKLTKSRSKMIMKPHQFTDIDHRVPNIDKASKILDYKPSILLNEGLLETIAWYKRYQS